MCHCPRQGAVAEASPQLEAVMETFNIIDSTLLNVKLIESTGRSSHGCACRFLFKVRKSTNTLVSPPRVEESNR